MSRPHRFTVRLSANEILAINKYADKIRAIPSVALRFLIAKSLADEKERVYIKPEQRTFAGSL